MIVKSRFTFLPNIIRIILVLIVVMVLPVFVRVIIDHYTSYFMIMMVPICLFLVYFVFTTLKSINTVYQSIKISHAGIEVRRFLGLGKTYFFDWQELGDYRLSNEFSSRGPHYQSFSVFKNDKTVLRFDSLTYRNFKQMQEAIEECFRHKQQSR